MFLAAFFHSCLLLLSSAFAVTGNESFNVVIEGRSNTIESYQKRAELKLARSTNFCRGFYLPEKIGAWGCEPVGSGKMKCTSKYKCGLINKTFSRVTESKRIRLELKKVPTDKRPFSMHVSKKSLRTPSKRHYVREVNRKRQQAYNSQKAIIKRQVKERANKIKLEMTEYDEFSKLEEELAIERTQSGHSVSKNKVDNLSSNDLEEDQSQLKEDLTGIIYRMERTESNSGDEEIIRISKGVKGDKEIPMRRKLKLLAFSGAMTQVQDVNDNTVATFDLAWTPRFKYSDKWAFRGRLGGHFISVEPLDGFDSETFLVYELGAEAEYTLFDDGYYLSAGLGFQSWGSTAGGTFTAVSIGGGYHFEFNKLKIFDRVFASYTAIGNEASNKELKIGLGVSF